MALTKITRGVIKANENYDTHNINSTGIVTAVSANFTGNVSIGGTLTYQDETNIDSVGVITARNAVVISEDNAIHFRGTAADDADAILRASAGGGQLLINSRNDAIINIDSNNDSTDAHFAIAHGAATGSSTELFRVQENGDVGINCTPHSNAGINLHIHGDNTTSEIRLTNTTTGTGANGSYIQQGGNTLYIGNSESGNTVFEVNGSERIRILSDGKVGINTNAATARLDISHPNTEKGLVVRSRYGNIATAMVKFDSDPDSNGGDGNVLHLHGGSSRTDSEILHIDSTGVGDIFDIRGDGLTRVYKQLQLEHSSNVAKIIFNEYGANDIKAQIEMDQINSSAGQLIFRTQNSGTLSERLRIESAGTIKCGTSSTLKAEINSAIGGHQFISQCSDNNNGFEIYQQHGSTTTRNTFAVYANTGGGGSQELQFSIRGDGCVTKPKSPAFQASLSGGNLNMATHNNVVVFNNQWFDNGNNYNTSNGRFTAPVAGRYYFGVQIYAGFALSGVRVLHSQFQKNGSDIASTDMFGGASDHGGTSYHPTGVGHMLIDLAANDWVAWNSGGFSGSGSGHATIYAASGTRFFGYLVG